MLRSVIVVVTLMLIAVSVSAQSHEVKGRVVDANGEPLEAATVRIKGKYVASHTDNDGMYSIMADSKDELEYSFIGYTKVTERVGKRTTINVVLHESGAFKMSDVVVTGYSTQERRDLTGSVA